MHRLVSPLLTVLFLALLFAPSIQASPAAEGCGYPNVNEEGAVVLTGDGRLNTRPFDLSAGAHTIKWQSEGPGQYGANLSMALKRTDGQYVPQSLFVNEILEGGLPGANGETQVYGVKPGAHYLEVSSPGPWAVTITPQR